jgi:RNA polymerase sigma-70 factor (ECF subfamily)
MRECSLQQARHVMLRPMIADEGGRSQPFDSSAVDEATLVVLIAGGDDAAFERLYRDYRPRLRRFVERITRCPQIVDEVLDDTMLIVWRRAGTYNVRSKVSTWIFGIAYRRALKALKHLDEPVEAPEADRYDADAAGPDDMLLAREERMRIGRALRTLSAEHRAVIELTYYEGHSCADIAEVMRCPVNTVKTRMFYARRQLRTLLAEAVEERR